MDSLAVPRISPMRPTVRLGNRPGLSLVVASPGGDAQLRVCLDALLSACRELDIEIVAVRCAAQGEISRFQAAYPRVRFVGAPAGSTIATLRTLGLAAAHGEIVVLTHDDAGSALAAVRRRVGRAAQPVTVAP